MSGPVIKVTIDELTMDSIVGPVYDGDEWVGNRGTLGREVALLVAERIAGGKTEEYAALVRRATAVRDEELRARLVPLIEQGLSASFQRTTHYGEPAGPQVTMREIIMDELKKALTQPVGTAYDYSGNSKHTLVQKIVAEMVKAEFTKIIQDAVQVAKKETADQIGAMVSAAVSSAMKK